MRLRQDEVRPNLVIRILKNRFDECKENRLQVILKQQKCLGSHTISLLYVQTNYYMFSRKKNYYMFTNNYFSQIILSTMDARKHV